MMTMMMPKIKTTVASAAFEFTMAKTPSKISKIEEIMVLSSAVFSVFTNKSKLLIPLIRQATPKKNKTLSGFEKAKNPTINMEILVNKVIRLFIKKPKIKPYRPSTKNKNVMIRTANSPTKLGNAMNINPVTERMIPSI